MKLVTAVILVASLAMTLPVMGQGERKYIRHGNKQYDEKNYEGAEIDYRKSLIKEGSSVPGRFNLGDAVYRQNNYPEAIRAFDTLRTSKAGKDVLPQAYYNLGNSLLKYAMDSAGRHTQALPASIEAYKNALRYDPNDQDAKYNLTYALKLVQQQQDQQNQQNQQQNDQKNQQQKQDQQKQDQQKQDQQQVKQQQNQQQQDQQQAQQDQQQGQQGQARQLSKEDAARMLEAMQNDEKNTLRKLREKNIQAVRVKTDKDW